MRHRSRLLFDFGKESVVLYVGHENSAQRVYDRVGFAGLVYLMPIFPMLVAPTGVHLTFSSSKSDVALISFFSRRKAMMVG